VVEDKRAARRVSAEEREVMSLERGAGAGRVDRRDMKGLGQSKNIA
jgi:hypothetical protein